MALRMRAPYGSGGTSPVASDEGRGPSTVTAPQPPPVVACIGSAAALACRGHSVGAKPELSSARQGGTMVARYSLSAMAAAAALLIGASFIPSRGGPAPAVAQPSSMQPLDMNRKPADTGGKKAGSSAGTRQGGGAAARPAGNHHCNEHPHNPHDPLITLNVCDESGYPTREGGTGGAVTRPHGPGKHHCDDYPGGHHDPLVTLNVCDESGSSPR